LALLRKSTLVFAEILLLIAVTAFLMLPEYVVGAISALGGLNYWLRLVIVVVVDLLIVLAVFAQLRGAERYRGRELVVEAGDCDTTVTAESTRQRLQRAIYGLQDIETVEGSIKGKRGKAVISLEITTSKDEINIPEKQREIDRVIKQVVVKQMGIKLAQPPVVNIRLASDAKESEEPSSADVSASPPTTLVSASAE
jgi:hypothetical protein